MERPRAPAPPKLFPPKLLFGKRKPDPPLLSTTPFMPSTVTSEASRKEEVLTALEDRVEVGNSSFS
jgi:hypothetical protein